MKKLRIVMGIIILLIGFVMLFGGIHVGLKYVGISDSMQILFGVIAGLSPIPVTFGVAMICWDKL